MRGVWEKQSAAYSTSNPKPSRPPANADLMLASLRGLVIIDEVHAMPELFRVLRVLADRPQKKTRFLILGSASPT